MCVKLTLSNTKSKDIIFICIHITHTHECTHALWKPVITGRSWWRRKERKGGSVRRFFLSFAFSLSVLSSSPHFSTSRNRFLTVRAACYVTYCFRGGTRVRRGRRASREREKRVREAHLADVSHRRRLIHSRDYHAETPVSLCARFFRSLVDARRWRWRDSGDVLFARHELATLRPAAPCDSRQRLFFSRKTGTLVGAVIALDYRTRWFIYAHLC